MSNEHVREYLDNQFGAKTISEDIYVDLLKVLDEHEPKPVYVPVEISRPGHDVYGEYKVFPDANAATDNLDDALREMSGTRKYFITGVLVIPDGISKPELFDLHEVQARLGRTDR